MQKKKILKWAEVLALINQFDPTKKYYGVPRGGQVIAGILNPVDTPEEADFIIDDLIESGATKERYLKEYPDKMFVVLIDKRLKEWKGEWIVFPWEVKDEPIDDNILRLKQFYNLKESVEQLKEKLLCKQ